MLQEFTLIDQLVRGCYLSLANFDVFADYSMLYFAEATTYEYRRHHAKSTPEFAFLCGDDDRLQTVVSNMYGILRKAPPREGNTKAFALAFHENVANAIRPFNIAGLYEPKVHHIYEYTAAPV